MKENAFYFFGPIMMNRIVATTVGVATAMALSMPFDTVKTRLHTMRPLPNIPSPNKLSSVRKVAFKLRVSGSSEDRRFQMVLQKIILNLSTIKPESLTQERCQPMINSSENSWVVKLVI